MKVLVCVDGSACAQLALESVCSRSWRTEDEFTVLTVVEPVPLDFELGVLTSPESCEASIYAQASQLAADGGLFLTKHLPVNSVEAKVLTGKAAYEISQWAQLWDADLIVVGSHGRRGFQHLVLGSVAEEVLKRSTCSVEVVIDKIAHKKNRKTAKQKVDVNQ